MRKHLFSHVALLRILTIPLLILAFFNTSLAADGLANMQYVMDLGDLDYDGNNDFGAIRNPPGERSELLVFDVSPKGDVSVNVCEGLTRVTGPGKHTVTVDLGHTCVLFRRGHRIRLHVCSGAHPRWMRNLQTGEPIATSTRIVKAEHRIGAGSVLTLPVLPGSQLSAVTSQL